MRGMTGQKEKRGATMRIQEVSQKNRIVQEDGLLLYRSEDDLACC